MELQPCAFIKASVSRETLSPSLEALKEGKYQPDPLKSQADALGAPVSILVEKNVADGDNAVEIHRHEGDLWIGIDGEVHFEVGGTPTEVFVRRREDGSTNELELRANGIQGGTTYTVGAGDILFIPAGQPHRHWTGRQAGRLWIIKIPAKEAIPLTHFPKPNVVDRRS